MVRACVYVTQESDSEPLITIKVNKMHAWRTYNIYRIVLQVFQFATENTRLDRYEFLG